MRLQGEQRKRILHTSSFYFRSKHPSKCDCTDLMYSSLFSSVTRTLAPSGLRSWEVIFPRISMSTEKYISRPHSSMLLSLRRHEGVESKSNSRGWRSYLFYRVKRVVSESTDLVRVVWHLLRNPQPHTSELSLSEEDIISPNPNKRVVELWVNGLQVFEDQLLVQHAFIERQRKACVDELAVEKCLDEKMSLKKNKKSTLAAWSTR